MALTKEQLLEQAGLLEKLAADIAEAKAALQKESAFDLNSLSISSTSSYSDFGQLEISAGQPAKIDPITAFALR